MKNRIEIDLPVINKNSIIYNYIVYGEWKEVFRLDNVFKIEYSCDVSGLPASVAIIPFLANLIPIAWVYDAEVYVPICDKDFYKSIPEVKKGYEEMYPMLHFGGTLNANAIEENCSKGCNRSIVFFSGGVDAFSTLISHKDEHPILVTLWGSDVFFDDVKGWNNVKNHISKTCRLFETDSILVKSSFRMFLNEGLLGECVKDSGDGWWHGFQHGIGLIGHAAPLVYIKGVEKVYIASTYTIKEKGKVTCASDPAIDNHVRFCSSKVFHDGYDFNRQDKVHNIVIYSEEKKANIPVRVCWQSKGGRNCCACEKCWRTILGFYAEGANPVKYGFDYDDEMLINLSNKMQYYQYTTILKPLYSDIQDSMHRNIKRNDLPKSIRWFYDVDVSRLGEKTWTNRLKKFFVLCRNF